jgi:hypothetical protein
MWLLMIYRWVLPVIMQRKTPKLSLLVKMAIKG